MGFNVRDYMLPPGTLIRFDKIGYNDTLSFHYQTQGIASGNIALVLRHCNPATLNILIEDRIINLSLDRIMDYVGWVPELTPFYCGSNMSEYPRWYPDYCYV